MCTVGVNALTVTFVGVGTCTLTPHVAASTDYLAADGSAQPFSVAKATPVISTTVFDAATGMAWTNSELTAASAYDTATMPA